MVKQTLLIAILGVQLWAFPAMAQGHHTGDGAWIPANPTYVTEEGGHCCGTNHCYQPKPGEMARINGAWVHIPTMTFLTLGSKAIYASEDPAPYICVWPDRLRCVFEATGG